MLLKFHGNEKITFPPNIVGANYNLIRNSGFYFNNNLNTGLWANCAFFLLISLRIAACAGAMNR
jgi:hypothetical protein